MYGDTMVFWLILPLLPRKNMYYHIIPCPSFINQIYYLDACQGTPYCSMLVQQEYLLTCIKVTGLFNCTGVKVTDEPDKKVRSMESTSIIHSVLIDIGGFCWLCVWFFVDIWITSIFLSVYQAVKRKQIFCRDVLQFCQMRPKSC